MSHNFTWSWIIQKRALKLVVKDNSIVLGFIYHLVTVEETLFVISTCARFVSWVLAFRSFLRFDIIIIILQYIVKRERSFSKTESLLISRTLAPTLFLFLRLQICIRQCKKHKTIIKTSLSSKEYTGTLDFYTVDVTWGFR